MLSFNARGALLLLALLIASATGLEAQRATQPAKRFPKYYFDSTFVIGGYSVSLTWLLRETRDELHRSA